MDISGDESWAILYGNILGSGLKSSLASLKLLYFSILVLENKNGTGVRYHKYNIFNF
jgi:hypothetical protein